MPPTNAISSFGTFLQMGDGATPEAFTTIAEVLDISGPELSLDTEEVTNHSSPNGWEEHIGTILRSGNVTADINFIPTNPTHGNTTGLIAALKSRARKNFRILLTDSGPSKWQIAALVDGFKPTSPVAGSQRASISMKVFGEPFLV